MLVSEGHLNDTNGDRNDIGTLTEDAVQAAPSINQISVRLLDDDDFVVRTWWVENSALTRRAGCFRDAFGDDSITLSGSELDLRHDDPKALESYLAYVKSGIWQDACKDIASALSRDKHEKHPLHDHDLKVFVLADKYDSRLLAYMCATEKRKAIFNIFVRTAGPQYRPDYPYTAEAHKEIFCWQDDPSSPPLKAQYLSAEQKQDFLRMHYHPALEAFGGEYPERLWKVFALIAPCCTFNLNEKLPSEDMILSLWGIEYKPTVDEIKQVLLTNHRLAFFCMWHESHCNIHELHAEYEQWLLNGDKGFLVCWGFEPVSNRGKDSKKRLGDGYYQRFDVAKDPE